MEITPVTVTVAVQQPAADQQLPVPDAVSGQGAEGMFALFLGNLMAGAEVRTPPREEALFPLSEPGILRDDAEAAARVPEDAGAALQAMAMLQQVQPPAPLSPPVLRQENADLGEIGEITATGAMEPVEGGEPIAPVAGEVPVPVQASVKTPEQAVSAEPKAVPVPSERQPEMEKPAPRVNVVAGKYTTQPVTTQGTKPAEAPVELAADAAVSAEVAQPTAVTTSSHDATEPATVHGQLEVAPVQQKQHGKERAAGSHHEQHVVEASEPAGETGVERVKPAVKGEAGDGPAPRFAGTEPRMTATEEPNALSTPAVATDPVKVVAETRNAGAAPAEATGKDAPVTHEHILVQVKEKLVSHDLTPGRSQVSLTLHPEHLGELKIMLHLEDQRLKVDVVAQNLTVKEALMQNLDGLRESLSRQNISVDRFDVSTGGGGFNEAFGQGRQAGQNRPGQAYPQYGARTAEPEVKQVRYARTQEHSLVDVRF